MVIAMKICIPRNMPLPHERRIFFVIPSPVRWIIIFAGIITVSRSMKSEMEKHMEIDELIHYEGLEANTSCPTPCSCPTPERVDCSQASLTIVPHNISKNAVYLLLGTNRLEKIGSECFKECPRIRTLDLKGNKISDKGISKRAFYSLSDLNHLYLSDNKLERIPRQLPDSLISLNLEGNIIAKIDASALALKGHLRHLHLHNNMITSPAIDKLAFLDLVSLEEVTLSDNLISEIPRLPDSVETLHLRNNQITEIPYGTFRKNKWLLALHLQQNNLTNNGLNHGSFRGLGRIEYLDLSENKLTEFPNNIPQNVKILHLEKNKISKITAQSMERMPKLEYLLLQSNRLNSSGIETASFARLRNLRLLHIFTNKLTEIPQYLPARLESLVVLSNDIKSLKRNAFAGNRHLKELNVRYNDLTNLGLEKGALRPLPRLETIDLTGNKLTALPSLPRNVKIAYLSRNRIIRIPKKSLSRLIHLRYLVMNDNRLKDAGLPQGVFHNSIAMKVLDLSYNQLKSIPKHLPPKLEYLHLQSNQIRRISEDAFANTPLLKVIFLRDNRLLPRKVAENAFHPLRFLERIELSWMSPEIEARSRSRQKRSRPSLHFRSKKLRIHVYQQS